MTDPHSPDPNSPEAIEAQIQLQREALARTLDDLGTKLDVKHQVSRRVPDQVGAPHLAAAGAALAAVVLLVWWRRR